MIESDAPFIDNQKKILFDDFIHYLTQRRQQLQDWEAHPPKRAAWIIHFLAALEITLSSVLLHEESLREAFLRRFVGIFIALLFAVALISRAGHHVAGLFKKDGHASAAFIFLQVGLLPFLLFLPIVVLSMLQPQLQGFMGVFFFLLCLQVLANWKESLEIAYELTSLQSALLLYVMGGLFLFVAAALTYVSFLRILTSAL